MDAFWQRLKQRKLVQWAPRFGVVRVPARFHDERGVLTRRFGPASAKSQPALAIAATVQAGAA